MKLRKLKKVFALSMATVMVLSGCNEGNTKESTSQNTSATNVETEAETETDTLLINEELTNGDFESKNFDGWETNGNCIHVQTDDWASFNTSYFVKMSSESDADFEISQNFKSSISGSCGASIDYEGFESFGGECELIVECNDNSQSVTFVPSKGWDYWETISTVDNPIEVNEGDIVKITVKGSLKGGDWGDFDNVKFGLVSDLSEENSEEVKTFDYITIGGATGEGSVPYEGITYKGQLVNNGNWIKGVDISSLISVENSGYVYKNADGSNGDLIEILKNAGINCVRVRIWNDPFKTDAAKTAENSYGGGVCDINVAVEIAKRCAQAGIAFYPDFHYSDWWSDPGRSITPKAWEGFSLDEKAKAAKEFTKDSLETLKETGVTITMVSVGNETNNWMAGEEGIDNIAVIMKSACEAVRDFDENILISVHFANPESANYRGFAKTLEEVGVDYDIFASSYYPFWHGTLDNLKAKLDTIAEEYGKLTMIAEYSYSYKGSQDAVGVMDEYETASEDGQISAVELINNYAGTIKNCIGTFYWEPAWPLTESSTWDLYGSGWTSSKANEYDPGTAPSMAQGSACSEQAWFDENGNQLKILTDDTFNKLWKDAVE